jgi:hypothetical protein
LGSSARGKVSDTHTYIWRCVLMTTAKGTFTVLSWNEEAYEESDGRKLTRAEVSQRFDGDIVGEGAAIWLMAYRSDGTAHFVGLQRITATIAGRTGTVVLETSGDFDGQVASWKATTVAGAAFGGL